MLVDTLIYYLFEVFWRIIDFFNPAFGVVVTISEYIGGMLGLAELIGMAGLIIDMSVLSRVIGVVLLWYAFDFAWQFVHWIIRKVPMIN